MNVITTAEKAQFRMYFERLKKPTTVAQMAADLHVSPNFVRRRLDALGRNVVKALPPLEGAPGRPATRYEARK